MGECYPIIQGVPVLLTKTEDPTHWVLSASYDAARNRPDDVYYEDTIGLFPADLANLKEQMKSGLIDSVDPIVSFLVGATSGNMYRDLIGKLETIPIPEFRMPSGNGLMLDIGCSWGRWSVAAAQNGYTVVGIDPSLGAVLAAKRLTQELGIDAQFVVADALRLPFQDKTFDYIFSYSVLQHLSRDDCEKITREAGRVSNDNAELMIQMANMFGIRSLYHLARRGFRSGSGFDVRYYSPNQLVRMFEKNYGHSRLSVDCYFGLGIQAADRHVVSTPKRLVIDASEFLRSAAGHLPFLRYAADSLYICSYRSADAIDR